LAHAAAIAELGSTIFSSPAVCAIAETSRIFSGFHRAALAHAACRLYIREHRVSAERLGLAAINAPD
jgi:hypothetical protein